MTSSDAHTRLSVRGEAERTVAPDGATMISAVSAIRDSKRAAAADLATIVAEVVAGLAELGGVVLTPTTARAPLTWSTQSMRTSPEYGPNPATGEHGPTGRHEASVSLRISVRDFALMGRLERVLNEHDALDVHVVHWAVDDDNPAWSLVRADAIHAALLKGQDYASALGGSVVGVEHVADAGLLSGDGSPGMHHRSMAFKSHATGGEPDVAALDPVPQVLAATIEARLTATIGPLPTR